MRFFFYGTLLPPAPGRPIHPVAMTVHRRLLPGLPARVRGRLHAIPDPDGWYPALTVPGAATEVHGLVCTAAPDFGPDDLARMDAYEDYRPDDPGGSLYRREQLTVRGDWPDPPGPAWVYVYRQPLPPGAEAIPGGDFPAWLGARGGRGYGQAS